MTAKEFRATLASLGLSKVETAGLLGMGDRQLRNYANGYTPVPEPVAILLRLVKAGRIAVDDIVKAGS
jgi:hypothetical protein